MAGLPFNRDTQGSSPPRPFCGVPVVSRLAFGFAASVCLVCILWFVGSGACSFLRIHVHDICCSTGHFILYLLLLPVLFAPILPPGNLYFRPPHPTPSHPTPPHRTPPILEPILVGIGMFAGGLTDLGFEKPIAISPHGRGGGPSRRSKRRLGCCSLIPSPPGSECGLFFFWPGANSKWFFPLASVKRDVFFFFKHFSAPRNRTAGFGPWFLYEGSSLSAKFLTHSHMRRSWTGTKFGEGPIYSRGDSGAWLRMLVVWPHVPMLPSRKRS